MAASPSPQSPGQTPCGLLTNIPHPAPSCPLQAPHTQTPHPACPSPCCACGHHLTMIGQTGAHTGDWTSHGKDKFGKGLGPNKVGWACLNSGAPGVPPLDPAAPSPHEQETGRSVAAIHSACTEVVSWARWHFCFHGRSHSEWSGHCQY